MFLTNTIEPFAVGFLNGGKYDDVGYRVGCGLLNYAKYVPITLSAERFYAGEFVYAGHAVTSTYDVSVVVHEDLLNRKIEDYPQWREELLYIKDALKGRIAPNVYFGTYSEAERKLTESKACWGGGWGGHGNPDYDLFLKLGTTGIKAKIEEYRAKNPGNDAFYDGLTLSMDALEVYADRYSMLADHMARKAEGEEKEQLLRIAKALRHCPRHAPRDFFEACQMFWLAFVFIMPDSPGRFDQFMIDYYRMSDLDDARLCMEKLWQLFYHNRTWNLCLSGSAPDGSDQTNEVSYLVLEVARKYLYFTPNITMRVHKNTPKELMDAAIETIAAGTCMPALYNDDCVIPALEAIGIPKSDAHEYCMNGCNQIDIMGKSHMGLEDGDVHLLKCLEFALFDGMCQMSGETLSIQTGNAETFADFDALMAAYKKQVEYVTDVGTDLANRFQKCQSELSPNPYRSCLIQGCIESAKDYKCGGPLYNHGQFLTMGIADTADSLAAIRHFVYDTKQYTMAELKAALTADFVGYEQLYRDFKTYKKFGNDDDEVDTIAAELIDHYYSYLQTIPTYRGMVGGRGGVYTGGCSPFRRAPACGMAVGAMPNGKRKGAEMLSDSIGSVPGEDVNGVTALLKSTLKYDHKLAGSGFILNIKFNKSMYETELGKKAIGDVIDTYFAHGGQQLSLMVVSREELEDALVHPENHRNLVVRVGGFSDYFVTLSPGLQRNIIARTGN